MEIGLVRNGGQVNDGLHARAGLFHRLVQNAHTMVLFESRDEAAQQFEPLQQESGDERLVCGLSARAGRD